MFLKLLLQDVHNNFVNGLHLVVCLRVINRREAFLDVKFIAEFSELLAIKLYLVV